MPEPLILCSNDDGIGSRGLAAAAEALSKVGKVVVVAPETEQSATSHSLTLHRPLRLRRVSEGRFALDGTPADCVYIALHLEGSDRVLPRRPDLVVSGINRGTNLGQDVFYSGTVAAAREGALRGIPAIAASIDVTPDVDYTHAAALLADVSRALLERPRVEGAPTLLLNINVPAGPVRGVVPAKLGNREWSESVEARVDPRGRKYFWIAGQGVRNDTEEGTDTDAFDRGLASISVLDLDLARHDLLARAALDALVGVVQKP